MKTEQNNQVQRKLKEEDFFSSSSSVHKSESSGRYSAEAIRRPIPEARKNEDFIRILKEKGLEKSTKTDEKENRLEEKWKNGLEKNKKIKDKLEWLETLEGLEYRASLKTRTGRHWDRYFRKYREDLGECGKVSAINICGDCNTRYALAPKESCSKRICPLCARRQVKKWFWNYAPRILFFAKSDYFTCDDCLSGGIEGFKHKKNCSAKMSRQTKLVPVHITLTLESREAEDLASELVFLQESFLKLRRRVFWKSAFVGAISSIEVTWNKQTGRPHPHIHILAFRFEWISQKNLSEEWESITGSKVVWINRAYSKKNKASNSNRFEDILDKVSLIDAIVEASKYVVKSEDLSSLKPKEICEFLVACRGRNLKDILGNLRGIELTEDQEEKLVEEIKVYLDVEEEKDSCHCWACGSEKKYIISVEYDFKTGRMVWIDTC